MLTFFDDMLFDVKDFDWSAASADKTPEKMVNKHIGIIL
ncbi:hypothetical protein PALI_a3497 [Pseudoalteromonas aliena SW19]|uniref:Uncharacterized protein n=1 Tax=Pseudoalteromonas aliena SW19 TaxID=1314866 RepID=A0ABR9DU31_9GAMM|nr:hypothetical protein [Pseudoalteromonas aliena SW19]